MNAALHENHMNCYEQIFSGYKNFEVTGESVVPDKMPDIGLIGDTNTHVFLRSKRVQNGAGIMEGDLLAGVCYLPDGAAGYRVLEISVPWQVQFDSETLSDTCVAVGKVAVRQVEARMLNPRKVLVKAQLCAELYCYEKRMVSVCDDMEDDARIQVRKEEQECSVIATACERTFVATDEYPLPPDLAGGEILYKTVQFRVDDVKTLVNKLIVKGSTVSEVIIAVESGYAEKVSFTSSFSFIAETDSEELSPDVKVMIMPTALYFDMASGGGQTLSMEAHGVCQLVAYTKQKLCYLSDAYSNFCGCNTEYRPVTVYRDMKTNLQRESVTGTIPCRGQVERVRFMTASVGAPESHGQTVQVPVIVSACLQYESGAADWVKAQLTAQFSIKDGEQLLCVRTGELHGMASGNGVEFRLALDGEVREESGCILQTISAIELDEESTSCANLPSLTVVRGEGELWPIARKYGSTVELIRKYNQLEETEVGKNTLLLIPRQRL